MSSRLAVGFMVWNGSYPFVFNCSENENTEPCGSEVEIIKSIEKGFPVKLDWMLVRNNPVQSLLNTVDVFVNTLPFSYYYSRFINKLRWTPAYTDRYAVFSPIVMQQENAFKSWMKLLTPRLVILFMLVYWTAKILMLLSKSKYVRADGKFQLVAKLVHIIILLYETIALGVLGNALAVIFSKASITPTTLPYTPEAIRSCSCLRDSSCKLLSTTVCNEDILLSVKEEQITWLYYTLNKNAINKLRKNYEHENLIFIDFVSRSFLYSHSSANSRYPMMYHPIDSPGAEHDSNAGFITALNKSRFVDETLRMLLARIDAQTLLEKEITAIVQQSGVPPLLFNSPEMNSLTYQAFPELTLSKFIPCGYLLAAAYIIGLLVLLLELIFKLLPINETPDTIEEVELEPQSSRCENVNDDLDVPRIVCDRFKESGVLSHETHEALFQNFLDAIDNYSNTCKPVAFLQQHLHKTAVEPIYAEFQ